MSAFAQVFYFGHMERYLLQTIGLLIAAVLLAFLCVNSGTMKRPRLIAILSVIGLAAVIWSLIDSGSRLVAKGIDQWFIKP